MKSYLSLILIISLNSILSFINQICIAHYFGVSADLDILNISMALPNSMMALSIGGLNLVLIPIFTSAKLSGNSVKKVVVFFENKLLIWGIIGITSILIIQVTIYSKRIPDLMYDKFIIISITSSIFLFLTLLNSIYISWANIEKRFTLTSFSGPFINLTSIIACIFLHNYLGIFTLSGSLLVSSIISTFFLRYFLSKEKHIINEEIKFNLPKLGLPILASILSVIPFVFPSFIDSFVLSNSLKGFVSYAAYSTKLMTVLSLLIIQPLNLILFPLFSEMVNSNKMKSLTKLIEHTIFFTMFISLLIIILINKYFFDVMRLFFEHGSFKLKDVINLMELMKLFVLGLAGMTLMNIFNRLFAALNENMFQIFTSISFIIVYFFMLNSLYDSKSYLAIGFAYSITWTIFILLAIIKFCIKFNYHLNYFVIGIYIIFICIQFMYGVHTIIFFFNIITLSIVSVYYLKKIIRHTY